MCHYYNPKKPMVDLTTAMAWQMERNAIVMLCAALGSVMGKTMVVHVRQGRH
jgi:hypothetical protein